MVHLGDVLKAIGPHAAIIFAAWIFMGFLQQRYDAAANRYREAVGDYRSSKHSSERNDNLKDQVLAYRHRIKLMKRATMIGLIAAILLILTLILAGLEVIVPQVPIISLAGIITLIGGFALVIIAAGIVIREGTIVTRQLDNELRDVADLASESGQEPGSARRQK